jgi:hypothetical protein
MIGPVVGGHDGQRVARSGPRQDRSCRRPVSSREAGEKGLVTGFSTASLPPGTRCLEGQ